MANKGLEKAMVALYESAGKGQKGALLVREAFKGQKYDLKDFSFRRLAETTMGPSWVENLVPQGGIQFAEEVVSSSFLNLANVVLSGVIIDEFNQADVNRGDAMAETRSVPYIQQGRDIGLTRVDAKSVVVREGESFPAFGLGEDWRTYPDTVKRGAVVELTKEAIAEDRTGRLIEEAQKIGEEIVAEKNERILKVVLGIDNSVYLPKGVASATYTASAPRKNLLASNELVDWTDVDAAWQLWSEMTHPVTGRPISVPVDQLSVLVMPAKFATASYVFNATGLEVGTETSAPAGKSVGVNPIGFLGKNLQNPTASQMAYYMLTLAAASGGGGVAAADAKKYWYIGAFAKAFAYLQNYPLTVITKAASDEAAFRRDVVFGVRASERGVMAVKEPRYVIKCTG